MHPLFRAHQLSLRLPLCFFILRPPFISVTGGYMTSYQLLRLRQVEQKTGLKRSQIYLYMKEGAFPRSIKIGPASVAWLESEIDEWINKKLSDR
ncbi:putative transcriptional regulator [Yersinia pestis CO92]|nr:unknown [Yersinia pestis]AAS61876.1 putative transcriptional regulator [Yersinia pestis biovar Microtus str. 91001]ABG13248.1 hypothetical protein YPA_1281 [Yersinia pestis Antiqua]EDM42645.1 recombination directionality factor, SLP1 family [Yersinia pestis CA88-4125]EEO83684.1 recombination directionality factor, SLP1 family [Yersinia pestis biovar Orientalis str. PEXU2]EEO90344.1 recombination directionality factor, SLP1 family [Yersinia pestis Pestoides A]EGF64090.1 transcriptional regu